MPALSPHDGQVPLISTTDSSPTLSPLLDSYSVPLIQDTSVADGDSYELLRTSTFAEDNVEDFILQSVQTIPTEIPATESEDDSLVANKDSLKCQSGAIRRYWEILLSIFDYLSLSSPRRDASQGDEGEISLSEPNEERILPTVPQYVLDYAPYVHLYSGEQYWPCDIAEHLLHTTPYLNYTPARAQYDHEKLSTLDDLNKWGHYVYLTSNDDVVEQPEWLTGKSNIPESRPQCKTGMKETYDDDDEEDNSPAGPCGHKKLGYSDAPAILIVVEKGDGVVDAFWFFFYSFNKGNTVFNVRFGNHVGDWEHTTMRFVNGEPTAIFLSEHDFGDAYTYQAVEKKGKRVSE